MKKIHTIIILFVAAFVNIYPQATLQLNKTTLMHEMRVTPSPLNNAVVSDRYVSLQWPLDQGSYTVEANLDGLERENPNKPSATKINYKIRLSQDSTFAREVILADCRWAFYNPDNLKSGKWYWQYGYVKGSDVVWSELLRFEVKDNPNKFNPPGYSDFIAKLPDSHPRILVFRNEWDSFIEKNKNAKEAGWYLDRAKKVLKNRILSLDRDINVSKLDELDTDLKKKAYLTRESRRIVDREEANTEVLIRAFVLTKDEKYTKPAIDRIKEMITWRNSSYFKGDFNQATILSLASMAYDSFYDILSEADRELLLNEIRNNGNKIFKGFANHLENHIADNHNWQMNLRIFSMAAYAVYGELEDATLWSEYAYNVWRARFPGLNEDGGWHNGDSYFHVNLRTLIEVPYFYSRVTGYDFFLDPWYKGSAQFVMYNQPPFSKSMGNGSSHQKVLKPNGQRLGYADALAKLTNNKALAGYVKFISDRDTVLLKKGFMAKPGDLSWFRLQCDKSLPEPASLKSLPKSYVFPQTGIAAFMSNMNNWKENAMLSFRSSPYGSTSHALANQNAFNTFYGGKSLFYSSGHHISFVDKHSIYCHRATRAHNTILVNGMGQKIGTEGYGWIPRYYSGKNVSYVLGDASNAYGEVISPLWLKRAEEAELEYTPENGWDKNHLKTFRRHVVELGDAGLMFIYDELEADTAVQWDYLLHTVTNPMEVKESKRYVKITATNGVGESDAYLISKDKLTIEQTDQFFYPAINWLRADDKGNFESYANHWHFKASTPLKAVHRFATIISTHGKREDGLVPRIMSEDTIEVGEWTIKVNLESTGKPYFEVVNKAKKVKVVYDDSTQITEGKKSVSLVDVVPNLEI